MPRQCPFCDVMAETTSEEVAHMTAAHPEVIEQRLRAAGIDPQEVNGRPVAEARRFDSALYEDAALIATRLSMLILSGDASLVEEIESACARIIAAIGPADPYEEPEAFSAKKIDMTDWIVTCKNCDNGFIVHGPTWIKGGTKEEGSRSTRICPYCGIESLVIDLRSQWQRAENP